MDEQIRIPGYRIIRELGSGGMATVYLAVQEKLNREVAVKVLSPALLADKQFAARFLKEAELAAKLHHSNIVPIYDVGQEGFSHYILMEYLESSLKDRLKKGSVELERAVLVVKQISSALSYAHSRGFVHRDIKPENIMFRSDGTAVLTDFGIAKAIGSATKLTKTGMSIGTPHYMSPEQARGKELDGRADIYSLGVVFYEMLTGNVPYEAEDSVAVAIMHIQQPIPQLPPRLKSYQPLLDRMMAKDREARVQTGDELMMLIDGFEPGSAAARAGYQKPLDWGAKEQAGDRKTPPKIDFGAAYRKKDEAGRGAGKMRGEPQERRPSSRALLVGVLLVALAAGIALLIILLSGGGGGKSGIETAQVSSTPSVTEEKGRGGLPSSSGSSGGGVKTTYDESKEKEFEQYMSDARKAYSSGDFDAAQRQLSLAESLKPGDMETNSLKQLIQGAIKDKRGAEAKIEADNRAQARETERARQDEAAWSLASRTNTQESYQEYLSVFPSGLHAGDAALKKAELAEQARKEEERRKAQPSPGQAWVDSITSMEFVWIPAGRFMMGSENGDSDEKPVHEVELDGFWMGKYEVTQGQWQAIMGNNPSRFKNGDNYPVESISWNDIENFISRLNSRSGMNFRFPTEAEWEYACRAGTTGDRYGNLADVAWHDNNSGNQTHPVGQKRANAWGLYDMLGNVWEWCKDWYGPYSSGYVRNPMGPSSGSSRVDRGGSWYNFFAQYVRAPIGSLAPSRRYNNLGFRLARTK